MTSSHRWVRDVGSAGRMGSWLLLALLILAPGALAWGWARLAPPDPVLEQSDPPISEDRLAGPSMQPTAILPRNGSRSVLTSSNRPAKRVLFGDRETPIDLPQTAPTAVTARFRVADRIDPVPLQPIPQGSSKPRAPPATA